MKLYETPEMEWILLRDRNEHGGGDLLTVSSTADRDDGATGDEK